MPEGNALLAPNVSSYSNPTVNQLLAAGGSGAGANAMDASTSNALGIANQAQQLQSGKVTIDQQTFNLAKAKMDAVHQLLGAVVANPSQSTLATQLGIGVRAGTIDPDTAADISAHTASFGDDRQRIQQFALDGLNNNASHQEILQQAYGQPGMLNTGSANVSTLTRTGPNAGTTLSGAPPIANTTTPGEKMGGLTTKNPDGSSTFRPNSTIYDDKGNFLGAGGPGNAPSIPVYRGAGMGGGAPAPAPAPGAGQGQGAAASPPPAPPQRGSAPGLTPVPPGTQDSGAAAPAGGSGPAGATSAAGAPGGMVTPSPQTLPVISRDMAQAALKAYQGGEQTAANRNIMRAFAVQNNLPYAQHMGAFEPQPAGVGAGIVVPPQPGAGQGAAPAGPVPAPAAGSVPPGRQPPPAQPGPVQGQAPQGAGGSGSFGGAYGGQPGQGTGLTVGLSPGQEASLKAGSDGYAALSSDVSNPSGVNQRLFQLRTALGALRNTQTGLGTQQRQQLVGYLASLPGGLAKWAPGIDPDSASSYDIATKYLTAYSLNTPGASRSDAGLSTAQSANANTSSMMQKAAQDVTLSNIGLENGKVALLKAFNTSGADPGTFGKFASQWMQGADPRAFALPDMTPAERGQLYSGLQGPAKAAFLATVKKGMAAKILTPNDLQGAAGNAQ